MIITAAYAIIIEMKNSDNEKLITDPVVRGRYATIASVTGIILNLLLFAGKLSVGILSLSVAVIADALNNLFDASSSLVTFLGFKMSGKRADKDHPMGHGRIEYITALIVAMIIIFVGAELLKTSIENVIAHKAPDVGIVTIIILSAAVCVKLFMFFFYRIIAKKINSSALRAASLDSLCDAVATTVVLASSVVTLLAGTEIGGWVDGFAGIAVACFIIFTGVRSSKETMDLLVGRSPDKKFIDGIYEFVKDYPEVVGIHDVMVHDYGPGRQIVSFHAEVPADSDFSYAHDVVDCIERDMQREFGCIVTIHLDPIVVNDEKVNAMRALAEKAAKEVDPAFTIHDFRMTDGGKHVNLIFDLSVPTDCKLSLDEAARAVRHKIAETNSDCFAVIKAEYPYI